MTPGILPNWESGPQNQPRANVAVSKRSGCCLSMGGTSLLSPADAGMPCHPPNVPAMNRSGTSATSHLPAFLTIRYHFIYLLCARFITMSSRGRGQKKGDRKAPSSKAFNRQNPDGRFAQATHPPGSSYIGFIGSSGGAFSSVRWSCFVPDFSNTRVSVMGAPSTMVLGMSLIMI